MSHMVVLLFLLPALVWWVQGQVASIRNIKKINLDAPIEDDASAPSDAEFEIVKKKVLESPKNLAIWQIGVSKNAVAISEEASLLGFNFARIQGSPSVKEITETILLVMLKPFEGLARRPSIIAFLPSVVLSDAQIKEVADSLHAVFGKDDLRVTTMTDLESELPDLIEKRTQEIAKNPQLAAPSVVQATAQAKAVATATANAAAGIPNKANQQKLPMNPTPSRGCFVCKKDIEAKTKQCSACKSVIYCSAECATKDWPTHKVMCGIYKQNMQRLADENLHGLPFDFYNAKKQLENFNQVPFLVEKDLHNVGVYRRLCQCFQQLQWGELTGELAVQMAAEGLEGNELGQFNCTGLPKELFPLGKALNAGVTPESIESWEDWYKAYGLDMSSPVALVFEMPLTVWYLIKKYAPTRMSMVRLCRRQLTIHMLGTEREADLIHIFSYILPLLPDTDIIIHMVGPTISKRLREDHQSYSFKAQNSTLTVTLTSAEYSLVHYDASYFGAQNKKTQGATPPDLVIILNGGVFQYQTFAPTIKLLMDKGARIVFTEPIETSAVVMGKQFESMKWTLSLPVAVNPFRQPVFQWKKEVNLPGWSNGFITGAGKFD
ncbi:hypothetical protein BCR33DRAFT_675996 [Rhizoclosmatium globosum]|uniref:MYND-type domain-containing protein n=1 Tax=Rhizoclosmatium globosum TaxID=329046 RepID=A0A1Y2CWE8_9FUNG|nr:hypothetical protein BCR33DRAFT_675996 [Rhizoclosmatium globosum]|eukprot:ORY51361.1 hypothetical protein BCR33DRAFT_675996 [Rhizoclosmatium globosum]